MAWTAKTRCFAQDQWQDDPPPFFNPALATLRVSLFQLNTPLSRERMWAYLFQENVASVTT